MKHWLSGKWPPDGLLTHIKNCEPLVSLPLFAIDSRNSLLCFMEKLSSVKKTDGITVLQAIYCINYNMRQQDKYKMLDTITLQF